MSISFDNTYARLPAAFHIPVHPVPVAAPRLIRFNRELATELGIDVSFMESDEGLAVLAGNQVAAGSEPIAMAYSGHQFGGFSPQLGDGRAVLLGEVVRNDGVRFDIQLKGSGPTPFSRRGDGRSALGPVLREYIVSEAMHALGVPTTRALACVASGEMVLRQAATPGGVFTRVARSHLRIGTFEWFAARGDRDNLRLLADYAIARHYPDAADAEHPYLAFLNGVIGRQAELIAHWMQLGFIHGVMNTDNMTVSGETIDYGPCAFMDDYHPAKTFSSIDHDGRYAFANQSSIGLWNLTRLAEALLPLIDPVQQRAIELATAALKTFDTIHGRAFQRRFLAKIGLPTGDDDDDDHDLIGSLLQIMAQQQADFTLVFRHLSDAWDADQSGPFERLFDDPSTIHTWLSLWRARIKRIDREQAVGLMRSHNPIYIPRNHRVEEAIAEGYRGDFGAFHRLCDLLRDPYHPQAGAEAYEAPPRDDQIVRATFCGT